MTTPGHDRAQQQDQAALQDHAWRQAGAGPARIEGPDERPPSSAALERLQATVGNHEVNRLLREDGGHQLDDDVRRRMEERAGADFRDVRIHDDPSSAERVRAAGAVAFTVGSDIYFASGHFRPDTPRGRRLLAHELTHVMQQTAEIGTGDANADAERQAEAAGVHASPGAAGLTAGPAGVPQLAEEPPAEPDARPRVAPAVTADLAERMNEIFKRVSLKTRESLRRKTLVIGQIIDDEGTPRLVYTCNDDWNNKQLESVAGELGIVRWSGLRERTRDGRRGAHWHGEQIMTGIAAENGYQVTSMAVSREACDDCLAETRQSADWDIQVVEVVPPGRRNDRKAKGGSSGGSSPARAGSVPSADPQRSQPSRRRAAPVPSTDQGAERAPTAPAEPAPAFDETRPIPVVDRPIADKAVNSAAGGSGGPAVRPDRSIPPPPQEVSSSRPSPAGGGGRETTETIPDRPAPSMSAPAPSRGAAVAGALGEGAAIALPLVINAVSAWGASREAEETLRSRAGEIDALRTPAAGVLIVINFRETWAPDPGTGIRPTTFESLYPVGGFSDLDQARKAVEGRPSMWWGGNPLSTPRQTFVWIPPSTAEPTIAPLR
ncbi:DUF4157 domain-containing protein [Actinoplanes sp. NPDC026623]|uniref:eCIS core domain-containing protein n=1 Tax=Actinoplanes sp. NPDC026623 TaxID=3155610 RepID=UPI0033E2B3E1